MSRSGDNSEFHPQGSGYRDEGYMPYATNNGDNYNLTGKGNGQRYKSPAMISSIPSKARAGQLRPRGDPESKAGKQIETVLELIKKDWPNMCEKECVPVQIAIQLLDPSSVGRAHEYHQFEETYRYLQESLKAIVHENHQGFNSSIGTFHKIQTSIQSAQKRVRNLKESMSQSKANIATTDPELKKLASTSQSYGDIIQILSEIEDLRRVPDQLEGRISEKRFMTAVDTLQTALRRIRTPELDEIGGLSDIRTYLTDQETALVDILIEELHDHLYLKSPYCQERWQTIADSQRTLGTKKVDESSTLRPFYELLDSLDLTETVVENQSTNIEVDSFYYIVLLVESLNKLNSLEFAVNSIKQRLPVELFAVVNETNSEVDQKHPASLRGSIATSSSDRFFSSREKVIRADVIYDLLWTLYAKFESIAENHRIFHEVVKVVSQREGIQNPSKLLGGFRELWHLYQNEIQSLLHNYVTSDADVYESKSSRLGPSRQDSKKEQLFRLSNTDSNLTQMAVEFQELEEIIRSAVPGLISGEKQGSDGKKPSQKPEKSLRRIISRQRANSSGYDDRADEVGSYKSLVEPSVFNMSLLLPPTLEFLQRLKMIVPPGSDLVTSTLTSFLDNFLVNVFLPQLDETLGKLSGSLFEEADSFQQDSEWYTISRRPVFKGTVAFFNLVNAFSRMLDNIPHDQALSQLIITQMKRYYENCHAWFKSLVSKLRESDTIVLKRSAFLATNSGDICVTARNIWASQEASEEAILSQIEKEAIQFIRQSNENPLELDDLITDREAVSSLCILYTSMMWLVYKIKQLRFITRNNSDSSRMTMKNPTPQLWSMSNSILKDEVEEVYVYLPMTEETVVGFDSVVSSYKELATTVLLTLHTEIRFQMINSLAVTLSSEKTVPYLMEQAVKEPDSNILTFNINLLCFDETIVRFLTQKEASFIRRGLSCLADNYFTSTSDTLRAMNIHGCQRMLLNIFVLQQNLKEIEPEMNLNRASKFYELFIEGPDAILSFARKAKTVKGKQPYSYEELKSLIQLCYSELISNAERGNTTAVKRSMEDHLLQLSEYMWDN